jgi:hypothetical protein
MRTTPALLLLVTALALAGCEGADPGASLSGRAATTPPVNRPPRSFSTDALVFGGTGVWAPELPSVEAILDEKGVTYRTVTSSELNAMSVDELDDYGIIVWPGGNGALQAGSLTAESKAKIRQAVRERGVGFVGFCAGSFLALETMHVVDGPDLEYYFLELQGTPWAMTMNAFADGTKRDLVWYGGPVTPELKGGVVARYPNGQASITETWAGNGFVVLSGPHPAAPQSIRGEFGLSDSDGLDLDLAWTLIEAALQEKMLPAF